MNANELYRLEALMSLTAFYETLWIRRQLWENGAESIGFSDPRFPHACYYLGVSHGLALNAIRCLRVAAMPEARTLVSDDSDYTMEDIIQ